MTSARKVAEVPQPATIALMIRRVLRTIALFTAVAAAACWLAAGANRGWTKTSVPVKTVDEVTGLEGIVYQKRFVPGVDFVGGAWLGAGILAGVSCLIKPKAKRTPTV